MRRKVSRGATLKLERYLKESDDDLVTHGQRVASNGWRVINNPTAPPPPDDEHKPLLDEIKQRPGQVAASSNNDPNAPDAASGRRH